MGLVWLPPKGVRNIVCEDSDCLKEAPRNLRLEASQRDNNREGFASLLVYREHNGIKPMISHNTEPGASMLVRVSCIQWSCFTSVLCRESENLPQQSLRLLPPQISTLIVKGLLGFGWRDGPR